MTKSIAERPQEELSSEWSFDVKGLDLSKPTVNPKIHRAWERFPAASNVRRPSGRLVWKRAGSHLLPPRRSNRRRSPQSGVQEGDNEGQVIKRFRIDRAQKGLGSRNGMLPYVGTMVSFPEQLKARKRPHRDMVLQPNFSPPPNVISMNIEEPAPDDDERGEFGATSANLSAFQPEVINLEETIFRDESGPIVNTILEPLKENSPPSITSTIAHKEDEHQGQRPVPPTPLAIAQEDQDSGKYEENVKVNFAISDPVIPGKTENGFSRLIIQPLAVTERDGDEMLNEEPSKEQSNPGHALCDAKVETNKEEDLSASLPANDESANSEIHETVDIHPQTLSKPSSIIQVPSSPRNRVKSPDLEMASGSQILSSGSVKSVLFTAPGESTESLQDLETPEAVNQKKTNTRSDNGRVESNEIALQGPQPFVSHDDQDGTCTGIVKPIADLDNTLVNLQSSDCILGEENLSTLHDPSSPDRIPQSPAAVLPKLSTISSSIISTVPRPFDNLTSEDADMLKDFLLQHTKARKTVNLESPIKVAKPTLISTPPRRILGHIDQNSPSPRKELPLMPDITKPDMNEVDKESHIPHPPAPGPFHEQENIPTPHSPRRSTRTRKQVLPKYFPEPPTHIPMLWKSRHENTSAITDQTEAHRLTVLTKANTRHNRGKSKPPQQMLKILIADTLHEQQLEENGEEIKAAEKEGSKSVTWKEELVEFAEEHDLISPSESETETEEPEPAAVERPKRKMKRLKAQGSVNGTPASKQKTKTKKKGQRKISPESSTATTSATSSTSSIKKRKKSTTKKHKTTPATLTLTTAAADGDGDDDGNEEGGEGSTDLVSASGSGSGLGSPIKKKRRSLRSHIPVHVS